MLTKLPEGFLDRLRANLVLSHVASRWVQWDMRKSNPSKGDYWSPCPFHKETSASFHIDDRKGFYYCFEGLSLSLRGYSILIFRRT
jgi:DNA primase